MLELDCVQSNAKIRPKADANLETKLNIEPSCIICIMLQGGLQLALR